MKCKPIVFILPFVLAMGWISSCKKYDNPAQKFEEYEQEGEKSVSRNVLIISIDGLVGQELKDQVPPTITRMMKNGKYSFQALTDENTSDAATWTTMMTGYNSGKHQVVDENYLPGEDPDHPHNELEFSPTVFNRIETQAPELRTAAIVRRSTLANVLLMDADMIADYDTDQAVRDRAIDLFAEDAAHFTVLQFTDVLEAGLASGFKMDNAEYRAAIERVDGYIGEILDALESRADAEYENWLVILTSNHGGLEDAYGGDSFQERNVFTLYYQKDLIGQELIPNILTSPRLYGYDGQESGPKEGVRARNEVVDNEEHYNPAQTGELTIEAKIKVNRNAEGSFSYSVPPFLSKTDARTGTTPGWSFFRNGNNIAFWVGDGNRAIEIAAGPVSVDDEWAHITATVKSQGDQVTTAFFINGVKAAENSGSLNINGIYSNSPLTFGFQPYVFLGGFIDLQMADVHIWDVALSDADILAHARRVGIDSEHEKYDHLKGYWPMDDGGSTLENKIAGMPDIDLQGPFTYKVTSNNLPYVDENSILMQNLDLPSQSLYWLGIVLQDSWALEGQSFLTNFELEFLK